MNNERTLVYAFKLRQRTESWHLNCSRTSTVNDEGCLQARLLLRKEHQLQASQFTFTERSRARVYRYFIRIDRTRLDERR